MTTTAPAARRPPPPPPEPRVLRAHEAGVQALAFLPQQQQQQLVSGDADGVVKLWDLASFRPRLSFPTPTGPAPTANAPPFKGVLSLHPLPNQQLLTQLRGGVLMTWDLGDGGAARTVGPQIATGAYHFCKAALCPSSPQPLLLAPTAESGAFCLWDLRAAGTGPALLFSAPSVEEGGGGSSSLAAMAGGGGGGGRGLCMALQLLLDDSAAAAPGGHALAAYEDGSVHAFDLRMAGSRAACGAKLVKETALSMDVGPSRTRGVVGSAGSELVVFGLDLAQHRIAEEARIELGHPGVADVRVRPDEKLCATAGWDHRVRAYRFSGPSPGKPLAVLRCHAESVHTLAFAPSPGDGGLLASGGKDARIALWALFPPE